MARGFDDIYKYFIIDLFYCNHTFHKQYNPYYQESSIHNHTVSFFATSPASGEDKVNASLQNSHLNSSAIDLVPQETMKFKGTNLNEKPMKTPNPPEKYCDVPEQAVHVGRAYWTRSCALVLYYHKWFNDVVQDETAITLNGTKVSSPLGIQVVEFRDMDGMSFHHLEFPESNGPASIDLSSCDISCVPEGAKELLMVAEDGEGNILKSKLNLSQLSLN